MTDDTHRAGSRPAMPRPPDEITPAGAANLLQRVRAALPGFSRANQQVGQYLIGAPEEFMHLPLNQIAARAGVSEPSVLRFCRGFGFTGVADFRIALAMTLAQGEGADTALIEPALADKAMMNRPRKEAIAAEALRHLGGAQSILLDGGSTMQVFARHLREAPGLIVMTTGLNVAGVLHGAAQHRLMLPGGLLRPESQSLVGELVEHTLARLRFDIVFLGADAIDPDFGLSTYNEAEARQNGQMIDVSARVVVLADSTKFRAPRLHRCCGPDRMDLIVTDDAIPDDIYDKLTDRGVTVVRVATP
ncbi:MAG: transcriptional regulator [Paracoccus sp. (in: a-proteobacteria)]|uniref:transcriptional regulator n=1 Tax=Paracoccus sp. TaxID=267 RepID=UPI0026DF4D98|nr:transcriptional regulator [Paracoccus sp. (in: a-proteobacteria)]MDO5612310.1 transcriptional regulator [Paracoccus sp. (in: a-proteobacteria)]